MKLTLAQFQHALTAGHHEEGGEIYADTAFLNAMHGVPGAEVRHLGFGEFEISTPKGSVEVDRMRGKDFEGQSGRSHKLYDSQRGSGALKWLMKEVEKRGVSQKMASSEEIASIEASPSMFGSYPHKMDAYMTYLDGIAHYAEKKGLVFEKDWSGYGYQLRGRNAQRLLPKIEERVWDEMYDLDEVTWSRRRRARFEEGKPADPTKNMSPEEAAEWEANTEKYRDKFKESDFDIEGRFEEGKPADPTKNMSPEDAEEWRGNTEKYRDKFKTAAKNWWEWGETHIWEFQPTSGRVKTWEGNFEALKAFLKRKPWDGKVLVQGPGHGTWTHVGSPSDIVNRVSVPSEIQRRSSLLGFSEFKEAGSIKELTSSDIDVLVRAFVDAAHPFIYGLLYDAVRSKDLYMRDGFPRESVLKTSLQEGYKKYLQENPQDYNDFYDIDRVVVARAIKSWFDQAETKYQGLGPRSITNKLKRLDKIPYYAAIERAARKIKKEAASYRRDDLSIEEFKSILACGDGPCQCGGNCGCGGGKTARRMASRFGEARKTIRVQGWVPYEGITVDGKHFDRIEDARDYVDKIVGRYHEVIVLGPEFSLGPNPQAFPYEEAPYLVLSRRGREIDSGYDSRSLFNKHWDKIMGWGKYMKAASLSLDEFKSASKYQYKEMSKGDYRAGSSKELTQQFMTQAKAAKGDDKAVDHLRKQVSYALAARSISAAQGEQVYKAMGLTADGGWPKAASLSLDEFKSILACGDGDCKCGGNCGCGGGKTATRFRFAVTKHNLSIPVSLELFHRQSAPDGVEFDGRINLSTPINRGTAFTAIAEMRGGKIKQVRVISMNQRDPVVREVLNSVLSESAGRKALIGFFRNKSAGGDNADVQSRTASEKPGEWVSQLIADENAGRVGGDMFVPRNLHFDLIKVGQKFTQALVQAVDDVTDALDIGVEDLFSKRVRVRSMAEAAEELAYASYQFLDEDESYLKDMLKKDVYPVFVRLLKDGKTRAKMRAVEVRFDHILQWVEQKEEEDAERQLDEMQYEEGTPYWEQDAEDLMRYASFTTVVEFQSPRDAARAIAEMEEALGQHIEDLTWHVDTERIDDATKIVFGEPKAEATLMALEALRNSGIRHSRHRSRG